MSQREDATIRATLAACSRFLRKRGEDQSYGYFLGGDPRRFSPDPECCTPAEIEAHRAACDALERGERPDLKPGCAWVGGDGAFGLGVTSLIDDEMLDLAEQCDRAAAMMEDDDA